MRFSDPSYDMSRVRALRADPVGPASDSPTRRAVFGAALQQFEELLLAAREVGPAASPILLFYALNQAGRAVVAAHEGEDRDVASHGLSTALEDHDDVTTARVQPSGIGWHQAVAHALQVRPLGDHTTIAELWAGLPLVGKPVDWADEYLPVLSLEVEATSPVRALVRTDQGELLKDARIVLENREAYGLTDDIRAVQDEHHHAGFTLLRLEWAAPEQGGCRIDNVADPYFGGWKLRPNLGEGRPLGVVPNWWAFLLALSSLARYHPAAWTRALAVDRSPLAVPLERALQFAADLLPALVFEALGGWRAPPQ